MLQGTMSNRSPESAIEAPGRFHRSAAATRLESLSTGSRVNKSIRHLNISVNQLLLLAVTIPTSNQRQNFGLLSCRSLSLVAESMDVRHCQKAFQISVTGCILRMLHTI